MLHRKYRGALPILHRKCRRGLQWFAILYTLAGQCGTWSVLDHADPTTYCSVEDARQWSDFSMDGRSQGRLFCGRRPNQFSKNPYFKNFDGKRLRSVFFSKSRPLRFGTLARLRQDAPLPMGPNVSVSSSQSPKIKPRSAERAKKSEFGRIRPRTMRI